MLAREDGVWRSTFLPDENHESARQWKGYSGRQGAGLILVLPAGFVQVFFFCGLPAPDVPFLFIDFQHRTNLGSQMMINLRQAFHKVFMYRRF